MLGFYRKSVVWVIGVRDERKEKDKEEEKRGLSESAKHTAQKHLSYRGSLCDVSVGQCWLEGWDFRVIEEGRSRDGSPKFLIIRTE